MIRAAGSRSRSPSSARQELADRLHLRRPEIEQAIRARVHVVAEHEDPAYVEGLRSAIAAAIDYAVDALAAADSERPEPIPAELLSQARRAARQGVPLDLVLRRYLAGYASLERFLVSEAAVVDLSGRDLQGILASQAAILDHLVKAVAAEHREESEARARSVHRRRAECVERILAGEYADVALLNYDLEGCWHVGLITAATGGQEALRWLAEAADCRLLAVPRGEVIWAWLGGRNAPDPDELTRLAASRLPAVGGSALGEPGEGIDGWRFTHRQAAAALPIARRNRRAVTRYADVALVATALREDVLSASLRSLYLEPLGSERDGGDTLRRTLRAYFAAERNVSSTAAALGISRKTVTARLRSVERLIGSPISSRAADMEIALQLDRTA